MHPTRSALEHKTVVIAGGGLAGISAAIALARQGVQVRVLEARQRLGGRTGSFTTEVDGQIEHIDYCQHVGMGCCTNLRQLIQWLGQSDAWDEQSELHFYNADGRYQRLRALPWVPPPLHLLSWLVNWPGLRWRERVAIAFGMLAIQRIKLDDSLETESAIEWLRQRGQTAPCLDRFWSTIVVSALGEQLDRVSLGAVVKVLQDGFLKHRRAFHLLIPNKPLDQLFNRDVAERLREMGVAIHFDNQVQRVVLEQGRCVIATRDATYTSDATILAIPWHALTRLANRSQIATFSDLAGRAAQLSSSPITGVHTWWDEPWLDQPQVAIVGRLCQWVFSEQATGSNFPRAAEDLGKSSQSHYYQIVISSSRNLPRGDAATIEKLIRDDLAAVFPRSRGARLLKCKVVTDPQAVFSVAPNSLEYRAFTAQLGPEILLAGDWTRTGWPATMEGAIISGFRAAESLLASWGADAKVVARPLHESQ